MEIAVTQMEGLTHLEWKGCELDMMLDAHGIDLRPRCMADRLVGQCETLTQPVGQWMSYSFTDLGAEGCCRSLNALLL